VHWMLLFVWSLLEFIVVDQQPAKVTEFHQNLLFYLFEQKAQSWFIDRKECHTDAYWPWKRFSFWKVKWFEFLKLFICCIKQSLVVNVHRFLNQLWPEIVFFELKLIKNYQLFFER
jgi:hypothetical protein